MTLLLLLKPLKRKLYQKTVYQEESLVAETQGQRYETRNVTAFCKEWVLGTKQGGTAGI